MGRGTPAPAPARSPCFAPSPSRAAADRPWGADPRGLLSPPQLSKRGCSGAGAMTRSLPLAPLQPPAAQPRRVPAGGGRRARPPPRPPPAAGDPARSHARPAPTRVPPPARAEPSSAPPAPPPACRGEEKAGGGGGAEFTSGCFGSNGARGLRRSRAAVLVETDTGRAEPSLGKRMRHCQTFSVSQRVDRKCVWGSAASLPHPKSGLIFQLPLPLV